MQSSFVNNNGTIILTDSKIRKEKDIPRNEAVTRDK